jgi:hypothetical protein
MFAAHILNTVNMGFLINTTGKGSKRGHHHLGGKQKNNPESSGQSAGPGPVDKNKAAPVLGKNVIFHPRCTSGGNALPATSRGNNVFWFAAPCFAGAEPVVFWS